MIDQAVERDASGAPVAFRIWAYGVTRTDKGNHLFDEAAAERLMAEQAERGNRYSFDVDHLSLSDTAPPDARIGAGSFRLEVRRDRAGKPELWATDCRWTAKARAGLLAGEWQSISPAYEIDRTTGRVVSLMNIALTNNPATHRAPRLSLVASAAGRVRIAANIVRRCAGGADPTVARKLSDRDVEEELSKTMTFDQIVEALRALSTDQSATPEERAKASQMLQAIEEREAMRTRMGLPSRRAAIRNEGCRQVFEPMTPNEARTFLARRGA